MILIGFVILVCYFLFVVAIGKSLKGIDRRQLEDE